MKVVLTGGKFNKVHRGHIWFLKKARSFGDILVVVIANDAHNKRPYALPAAKRKKLLAATGIPDRIVVGDPKDYFKVVKRFMPAVIVLGYDQRLPPGTSDRVRKLGIKIVKLKKHDSYSTRKMKS